MSNLANALRGRFVSMESDVQDLPNEEGKIEVDADSVDESGAQVEGVETVEGDMLETEEASGEVEDAIEDGEELSEVSDGLEAFLDAAIAGRQAGGWTRAEASAYQLGLECLLNRVGAGASAVMPSCESFDSHRGRLDQTVSVENRIKEALQSLWKGIKNMLSKMYAFFHKWYMKLLDTAQRLQNRAKAIKKAAENRSGAAKEKKIKVGVLSGLHIDKAMPAASVLKAAIVTAGNATSTATSDRLGSEFSTQMSSSIETLAKAAEDNDAIDINAANDIGSVIGPIATAMGVASLTTKPPSSIAGVTYPDDSIGGVSGKLPGGQQATYTTTAPFATGTNDPSVENVKARGTITKLVFGSFENKKVEVDNDKQVDTLSLSDIIGICDAAIDALQYLINYKSGYAKYDKALKDGFKAMEKAANTSVEVDEAKTKGNSPTNAATQTTQGKVLRGLISAKSTYQRNTTNAISAVSNYTLGLCRNSVAYCNSSLGQYSK